MSPDEIVLLRYAISVVAVFGIAISIVGAFWCLVKVMQHLRKTLPTLAYLAGPLMLFSRNVDEKAQSHLTWFWKWVAILVVCLVAVALFYPFPSL